MRRRMRAAQTTRLAAVSFAVLCVVSFGSGGTYAAFTGQTQNTGNVLAAKPDWIAPTVSASAIAATSSTVSGTIASGQSYYVYANVTDDGAPPSGVATVVANVSNLTTGASNVALASGTFSVDGISYGWRSDALTADAELVEGPYTYTHATTDAAGNTREQVGFPVEVVAAPPSGIDFRALNAAGGTAGTVEAGDIAEFVYSQAMDPTSILTGWDGSATNVQLSLTKNAGTITLTVQDGAGAATLPLGHVVTGDLIKQTMSFGSSVMTMPDGATVRIVLGVPSSAASPKNNISGTMQWTPDSAATNLAGVGTSTTPVDIPSQIQF